VILGDLDSNKKLVKNLLQLQAILEFEFRLKNDFKTYHRVIRISKVNGECFVVKPWIFLDFRLFHFVMSMWHVEKGGILSWFIEEFWFYGMFESAIHSETNELVVIQTLKSFSIEHRPQLK
jgi:hypothetical protein